MAIHEMVNFNKADAPKVKSGDVLIECMIAKFDETEVFKGLTNLTVIGGNCINCVFPADTKFGGCAPEIETPNIAKNTYELIDGRFYFASNKGKMSIKAEQKISKTDRATLMQTVSPQIKNKQVKKLYKKELEIAEVSRG